MQKDPKNLVFNVNDIPRKFKVDQVCLDNYLVNGKIKRWNGPFQTVFSPIEMLKNNEIEKIEIGKYPLMDEKTAIEALDAAAYAYSNGRGIWPTMTVEERAYHVLKFVNKMIEQRDNIIKLLMWEIAKSFEDSTKEFDRTIKYIKDTINEVIDLDRNSSKFSIVDNYIAQIRRSPLGVVLSMGPYNYPLNETFTTLIPAVIMGNTVVVKPPRLGVLIYNYLIEAFQSSFPPGVINIIFGKGTEIITPIIKTGKINVLAFVGSSQSADSIRSKHPIPHRLRCVLGMDAKNPAIILKDADIGLAVKECIDGTLSFNGQRCTALKIIFVHNDIVEEFIRKFTEAVDKIKIGMPWENDVKITPIADNNRISYFSEIIKDALEKGGKIINTIGGIKGFNFFYPTVVYPVKNNMKLYWEEQFGPVIPISSFNSIDEPLEYVINSNFGQQASIFGNNADEISYLIDNLANQVCRININAQCQRGPDIFPFTGRKDSAENTLSVFDALRAFSIRSAVVTKGEENNKSIIREIISNRKSKFLSTNYIL